MENKKVILTEVSDDVFKKSLDNTETTLKKLEKPINALGKTFEGLEAQERFFLCDGLVGTILNMARLPSYMLSAIAHKYSIFGQLPLTNLQQMPVSDPNASYIG